MQEKTKKLITAVAILIGTVIGAGVLGMPYVAAKSGFIVLLGYLLIFGSLILWTTLCFGEVLLRTKGPHHLTGIAYRYLGRKGKTIMFYLMGISVFSSLIAYMIGVGESISFIIFGNSEGMVAFGALFGFFMSYLLWGGISSLKKFEKIGVGMILIMIFLIVILFYDKIDTQNLQTFNPVYILLPFGVVMFSLVEFYSLPSIRNVLTGSEKLLKKAIFIGMAIPIIFYVIFNFIVVGYAGENTPEVSTLELGPIFIILGIITMFTSYLSLGTALERSYMLDFEDKKKRAWFKATIIPIVVFLLLQFFEFFSFVTVISAGGVIAGGLITIMILIIHQKAKKEGNRKPEYEVGKHRMTKAIVSLLFLMGIVLELGSIFGI